MPSQVVIAVSRWCMGWLISISVDCPSLHAYREPLTDLVDNAYRHTRGKLALRKGTPSVLMYNEPIPIAVTGHTVARLFRPDAVVYA